MKAIFTISILFFTATFFSQTTLSGTVVNGKGNPIPAANIFIKGTYDGAFSNEKGEFAFTTTATGSQTLVVSSLIYETSKTVLMYLIIKIKS